MSLKCYEQVRAHTASVWAGSGDRAFQSWHECHGFYSRAKSEARNGLEGLTEAEEADEAG